MTTVKESKSKSYRSLKKKRENFEDFSRYQQSRMEILSEIFKRINSTRQFNITINSLCNRVNSEDEDIVHLSTKPKYQRKYVWDDTKATSLIETILMGLEIPPLIIQTMDHESSEVIDGRQRAESIERFVNNRLILRRGGLDAMPELCGKKFKHLPDDLQVKFESYSLRVIDCEIKSDRKIDKDEAEIAARFLFQIYNSGLTALSKLDIESAESCHKDSIALLDRYLLKNEANYLLCDKILLPPRFKNSSSREKRRKIHSVARECIAMANLPADSYSSKLWPGFAKRIVEMTEGKNFEAELIRFTNFLKISDIILSDLCITDAQTKTLLPYLTLIVTNCLQEKGIQLLNDREDLARLSKLIASEPVLTDPNRAHYRDEKKHRTTLSLKILREFNVTVSQNLSTPEPEGNAQGNSTPVDTEFISHEYQVGEIVKMMKNNKILLRPPYQREEKINREKASGIIESILLRINLPPVYMYERNDGVIEIIDGQQRLLSILGFLGKSYTDESGAETYARLNNFPLKKLKVLQNEINQSCIDLGPTYRRRINSFRLKTLTVKQKFAPEFSPVDLFLRLNRKPMPVRADTFENWNCYIPTNMSSLIKDMIPELSGWLFSSAKDKRMKREETLMICLWQMDRFLNAPQFKDVDDYVFSDCISVKVRNQSAYYSIKNKKLVTNFVKELDWLKPSRERFHLALAKLKELTRLLAILLDDRLSEPKDNQDFKNREALLLDLMNIGGGSERSTSKMVCLFMILFFSEKKLKDRDYCSVASLIQRINHWRGNDSETDRQDHIMMVKKELFPVSQETEATLYEHSVVKTGEHVPGVTPVPAGTGSAETHPLQ